VYQFVWHEFCDWYLEIAKRTLYGAGDPARRARTQQTMVEVLETALRLLHPFMPFITEEIWQRLPHAGDSIMVAPFPKVSRRRADPEAERHMAPVIGIVTAIRNIRSESRVGPAVELRVTARPAARGDAAILEAAVPLVDALARCALVVSPDATRPPNSAFAAVGGFEVFVELAGVVDLVAERQRLAKEIRKTEDEIAFLAGKLGRPEFVERAPAEVVEREQARLEGERRRHARLRESLEWIAESPPPA
jgi:valyl-tRNA synthetase